jgi:hypothetical protein
MTSSIPQKFLKKWGLFMEVLFYIIIKKAYLKERALVDTTTLHALSNKNITKCIE